jgi:ribosomal protein S18 acetylase RimI-like enzyme
MAPALARAAVGAPGAFPRFARSGAALKRALPDAPVWYLQALGVHLDAQRRAIGAALLAADLAMVDSDQLACHLHTSDPAGRRTTG